MASSAHKSSCSEVSKLGATSEWIVANTGHSRSQLIGIAVKQLVTTLCDVLVYYNCHLELSPPSELLLEAQELCIPIANHTETFPLIEALLQHCHQKRWEFQSSEGSGSYPTVPVCPLSQRFLQAVTQLQSGGYNSPSKSVLSYKSQVVLWTEHSPALQQEILGMAEVSMACSEDSLLTRINARNLPKACAEYSKLYISSECFLRELVQRQPDKSRVLYLFNKTVTSNKASFDGDMTEELLSQHIPCLHNMNQNQ